MQAPSKHCFLGCSICLEGVSCGFNPPSSTQILHDPQFPAFDWWREEMAKPAQAGIQDPSCHQISHERWVPFVPSGSYALLRYRSCMNAATVFSLRKTAQTTAMQQPASSNIQTTTTIIFIEVIAERKHPTTNLLSLA